MNRELPIVCHLVNGPLDGQVKNLWPSSLYGDVWFLCHDAVRAGSPGAWFSVYGRLSWKPPAAEEVLVFVRWEWRERNECGHLPTE